MLALNGRVNFTLRPVCWNFTTVFKVNALTSVRAHVVARLSFAERFNTFTGFTDFAIGTVGVIVTGFFRVGVKAAVTFGAEKKNG